MPRILAFAWILIFLGGCLSLWPWMYSRAVIEEAEAPQRIGYKLKSLVQRSFVTRPITQTEKQFDLNHNGQLEPGEAYFLRQRSRHRGHGPLLSGSR